ncbi:MAG: hypothetical protein BV456_04835 [Thermoplasmata archaeon M8B2D]|nr:MAG: hypothetical protein BV456_04835 [Thermoplasmata archaeon M8B2D]
MTYETASLLSSAITIANKEVFLYIIDYLVTFVIFLYIIAIIIQYIFNHYNIGFDNSDDFVNNERSGFKIRTDHLTSLQYIETRKGHIIPRLDENGKHMRKTE